MAMQLHGTPHAQIATSLEISRGTIHNEIGRFKASVEATIKQYALDEADTRVLLDAVLHILEAGGFGNI